MMLVDDPGDRAALSLTYYLIDYTLNLITRYDFLDYQRQFNMRGIQRYTEEHGIPAEHYLGWMPVKPSGIPGQ